MKTKLVGAMLLAGSALFAAPLISIGIGMGGPAYYPPAVAAVRPPCPGPDYSWVDGYWAPNGAWVDGYWAAPYVAPQYPEYRRDWDRDRGWDRGRWDGDRGDERERDHNRGRDNGTGFHR